MSTGRDVVFLGPSLPLAEAREILPDALFLPPVAQGDILSLLHHDPPAALGIVDGVFYMAPPVWHKEILQAIELGIPVYGASSMGALRAAECDRFGMVGVGEVYRRYAAGELTDDDEVALVHGDAEIGWIGATEPLVNVRATLEAEVEASRLAQDEADAVIAAVKTLWFPERRRRAVIDAAHVVGVGDVVEEAFAQRYVDLKGDDARALLARMRDRDTTEAPAAFTMDRSMVYLAFADRDRKTTHAGLPVRLDEIKRHAAAEHPDFADVLDRALDRLLAIELARVWEVEPTEAEIDDELVRLRWRLRIEDDAAWCEANDLTEAELRALAAREATVRKLRTWVRIREDKRQLVRPVLDELRLRGEYPDWAARAAHVHDDAADASSEGLPTGAELVREHINATGWRPDPPIDRFAEESGFADLSDLIDELALSGKARRARRESTALLASLLGGTENLDT
jgi:hypothetical protein